MNEKCLAEEWHRDGRGLWAMRFCQVVGRHRGGRHIFGSWHYNMRPPADGEAQPASSTPPDDQPGNAKVTADMTALIQQLRAT